MAIEEYLAKRGYLSDKTISVRKGSGTILEAAPRHQPSIRENLL
jgi:hypothetical protein